MPHSKATRMPVQRAISKVQPIDGKSPQPPNLPPTKSAFIPKQAREVWADCWLSGRASLMKLCRTNRGVGLLGIESAVLTEIQHRLRRAEEMQSKVAYITRRAA